MMTVRCYFFFMWNIPIGISITSIYWYLQSHKTCCWLLYNCIFLGY